MKHILLNFNHFRTPKKLGGLRSWHIGARLAKRGYRVTAVVPGVDTLTGEKKKNLKGRIWTKELINGVEVIWVNSLNNDRKIKSKRVLYYLSSSLLQTIALMHVRKVDLILSMSMPVTSMLFAYIQSKIRNVPFVIDVRDLPTDTAIEIGYLNASKPVNFILQIEKWLFNLADCLICVSDGWSKRLKEKGVARKKIHLVPLGFDGREIYSQYVDWQHDIKKELGLKDKFVVAYVGTLGHVFDISTILNTAKITLENKEIVYLFAGGGQRLEEFKRIAFKNKLNCIFLGPRPKSDIPLICSQMDLCICPYKNGKFVASILGNKIFDYMGNGTATIYSGPEGDVSNLLKNSKGGVCVPTGDSAAIAEALIYFYNNPYDLKILGENAKEYIQLNYNVKNMMDRFENAISQLL